MDIAQLFDLSKSQGFALVLLLMIWAQLLFGGMMVGNPNPERTRRMPVWTRIGSSVMLVFAAWILFSFLPAPQANPLNPILTDNVYDYVIYIAIGMTLGLIGDLFMAKVIRIPRVDPVLPGMIAFGLGHIVYILGLLDIASKLSLNNDATLQASLVVWWIIAGGLWFALIFLPAREKRGLLHFAALPYALLLASTVAIACALALENNQFVLVALGAILFLVSDLILAMHLFNKTYFPLIDDVVWLTYGPGQMLIVYGIVMFGLGFPLQLVGL
ncbi:MAG: lysoplasmalogenase [Aggregatilineales bacterium]